jgi:NAD+ synthase (glutamine-hydrolysing)
MSEGGNIIEDLAL